MCNAVCLGHFPLCPSGGNNCQDLLSGRSQAQGLEGYEWEELQLTGRGPRAGDILENIPLHAPKQAEDRQFYKN